MIFLVLFSIFCVHYANCAVNCDDTGINYYEQLGCIASHFAANFCPINYKCPLFEIGAGFCMSGGKKYLNGESIVNSAPWYCNCYAPSGGGPGHIICKQVLCMRVKVSPGCYVKSKLDGCCPTEQYCPNSNSAQCSYDGVTYTEFQSFSPKNTCYSCVCLKNFRGLLEQPFCRRRPCNLERYSLQLQENCTPYYRATPLSTALCCPAGFICPEEVDSLNPLHLAIGLRKTCSLGVAGPMAIGDKVVVNYIQNGVSYSVTCTCKVGPQPLCIAN